jgi:hypothetical protein
VVVEEEGRRGSALAWGCPPPRSGAMRVVARGCVEARRKGCSMFLLEFRQGLAGWMAGGWSSERGEMRKRLVAEGMGSKRGIERERAVRSVELPDRHRQRVCIVVLSWNPGVVLIQLGRKTCV